MDVHKGDLEEAFLKTLDEKEFMAYSFANRHLGTLFSLDKSNAYLEWLQKQKEGGGEKWVLYVFFIFICQNLVKLNF